MNMLLALLLFLTSLLIAFVIFATLLMRYTRNFLIQTQRENSELLRLQIEKTDAILQKTISLLGTKDPLSYQAVATMDNPQSLIYETPGMSDQEEADRWLREHPEGETLDDSLDRDALAELRDAAGPIPNY